MELRQCKLDKDKHEADGMAKRFSKQSREFWKAIKEAQKDRVNVADTSIGPVSGFMKCEYM